MSAPRLIDYGPMVMIAAPKRALTGPYFYDTLYTQLLHLLSYLKLRSSPLLVTHRGVNVMGIEQALQEQVLEPGYGPLPVQALGSYVTTHANMNWPHAVILKQLMPAEWWSTHASSYSRLKTENLLPNAWEESNPHGFPTHQEIADIIRTYVTTISRLEHGVKKVKRNPHNSDEAQAFLAAHAHTNHTNYGLKGTYQKKWAFHLPEGMIPHNSTRTVKILM